MFVARCVATSPVAAGPRRLPMLTSALDEEEDDDDDDLRDALGNISDAEQDGCMSPM